MANAIWQATIVDQSGNVLPGAEVEVVNESTGLSAPLFSTRTGTSKSNPFFADANGFAQFYAATGLYRITATSSGTGTTMTWRNVRLVDVATNAEAIAGTAGVLPDAAGVKAAVADGLASLGTAATRDITTSSTDTTVGRILKVWDYGIGTVGVAASAGSISDLGSASNMGSLSSGSGIYHASNSPSPTLNTPFSITPVGYDPVIRLGGSAATYRGADIYCHTQTDRVFYRAKTTTTEWRPWVEFHHTGNTTVDSNGFIKEASPIVKLHSDSIEKNGDFAADLECIGTGHYVIKNTLGFAQEGWYIETPKDANGNIKVFVEYEDNGGDITVKTYEPDYSTGRATAGVAVDIPADRWIDIRLHELPPEPVEEEVEE